MNIFGIGLPEMAVIAAIGLLVFGPKRLPELGKTLGKTLKGFQSASSQFEQEFRKAVDTVSNDTVSATAVSATAVSATAVSATAVSATAVSASAASPSEVSAAGVPLEALSPEAGSGAVAPSEPLAASQSGAPAPGVSELVTEQPPTPFA
jgi:sec-independent protein translocase protein TatA